MTATTTGAIGAGAKLFRRGIGLALVLAIAAGVLLALGPLGWRVGWWHYRVGFGTLMPWAFWGAVAAAVLAVLALVFGLRTLRGRHFAIGIAAIAIAGAVAFLPWHYNGMRGKYPSIHDITTDWQTPPELVAALPLRQAEAGSATAKHGGAATADLQRKAYPDIAPMLLDLGPAKAFDAALATARQMGWTIVATDPGTGRIEAYDQSRWFGFTDDIVIRIALSGVRTQVDIRSVSRQGRGDFGVNAARVRAFLTALRAAAPPA